MFWWIFFYSCGRNYYSDEGFVVKEVGAVQYIMLARDRRKRKSRIKAVIFFIVSNKTSPANERSILLACKIIM